MTNSESHADMLLSEAKENLREALRGLDPAPHDPIAGAMLRAMDAIDDARKEIKRRSSI